MPYRIVKSGTRYAIVNKDTGKTVGHSSSRAMAQASVRARYANEKKGASSGTRRKA